MFAPWQLPLLFGTGLVAGFVDSIAGGGGMITLPVLLSLGIDLHPRMSRLLFDATFGLGIGFYDGFFGPGTGTFWTMAFMLGLGFNLTRATGYSKVVNFASNASSLAFFLASRSVYFAAGLSMGLGQLIGAQIGARMVMTRGTKFIRPIFITVVLALTLRLLYGA